LAISSRRCERDAPSTAVIEAEMIAEPQRAELAEIKAVVGEGMQDAPTPFRKAQRFVAKGRVEPEGDRSRRPAPSPL
jgi:hypothetical protein